MYHSSHFGAHLSHMGNRGMLQETPLTLRLRAIPGRSTCSDYGKGGLERSVREEGAGGAVLSNDGWGWQIMLQLPSLWGRTALKYAVLGLFQIIIFISIQVRQQCCSWVNKFGRHLQSLLEGRKASLQISLSKSSQAGEVRNKQRSC